MIRQAHTYLVSAMSGATLIAIAIVVFVLLVSAQVFRDFPLAGLNGGDDGKAHVSDARAATAPAAVTTKASPGAVATQQQSTPSRGGHRAGDAAPTATGDLASTGAPAVASEPAGSEGGGGNRGSADSPASSPASAPTSPSQSSSSSGGNSSSGGSKSGGETASTASGKVTETVNNTVNQVDETATGGTLGKTGVTEVTEGVVNGVAGPESPLGKVVDETVKTVGGLLGGKP